MSMSYLCCKGHNCPEKMECMRYIENLPKYASKTIMWSGKISKRQKCPRKI